MIKDSDIQTDVLSTQGISVWIEQQCKNGNESVIDSHMHDELLEEAHHDETDVFMDDHETVVVDTPSFTGSHAVDVDRDGVHVTEVGFYVHDDTDWEMEVSCPIDPYRLKDTAREHNDGEPAGAAALTVGERNPSMGRRRL